MNQTQTATAQTDEPIIEAQSETLVETLQENVEMNVTATPVELTEAQIAAIQEDVLRTNERESEDMTPALGNAGPNPNSQTVDAQVEALTQLIAALHPEAYAEAVKRGILRLKVQQPRKTREAKQREVKEIKEKTPKPVNKCACGCATDTMSAFAPGHDQRCKGLMIRAASGKLTMNEMTWKPSDALRAYASDKPMWSALVEAFDAAMTIVPTAPIA